MFKQISPYFDLLAARNFFQGPKTGCREGDPRRSPDFFQNFPEFSHFRHLQQEITSPASILLEVLSFIPIWRFAMSSSVRLSTMTLPSSCAISPISCSSWASLRRLLFLIRLPLSFWVFDQNSVPRVENLTADTIFDHILKVQFIDLDT